MEVQVGGETEIKHNTPAAGGKKLKNTKTNAMNQIKKRWHNKPLHTKQDDVSNPTYPSVST